MFVVDTNVLIYAANEDAAEHARCRELLEGWRVSGSPWFTTWTVLYEFIRVVTHPRVLERPRSASEAFAFVRSVLDAPGHRVLLETDRHGEVAAQTLEEMPQVRGNLVHDLHTAVLMREHGVKTIYTRDADFHRFPFVEVVDPLV